MRQQANAQDSSNSMLRCAAVPAINPPAQHSPAPACRHLRYPLYKAQRPEQPPQLMEEVSRVLALVDALGIPVLAVPGVEADDVAGSLAVRAQHDGFNVVLVSTDKVSDRCAPGVG